MNLTGGRDLKRYFLILNAPKVVSHAHLRVTIHPGLPDTVPFVAAFLAYLLTDLLSLLNISL